MLAHLLQIYIRLLLFSLDDKDTVTLRNRTSYLDTGYHLSNSALSVFYHP